MTINVFQKNWAFTSKEAEKPIIRTGSFGPCCVVTFASERYVALTHMDTGTDYNSIDIILKTFTDNAVALKDVKVIVLGGWKDCELSFMACGLIAGKILRSGFGNVSIKNMFTKSTAPENYTYYAGPNPHYHFGAQIDARTGDTHILKKEQLELNLEQHSQYVSWRNLGKKIDLPITQVF